MLLVRLKNELSHHLYLCQHYLQLNIDIVDIIIDRIMNEGDVPVIVEIDGAALLSSSL